MSPGARSMPTLSRPMLRSKKQRWRLVVYTLHACINKYSSQVLNAAILSPSTKSFEYSSCDRKRGPPCRVPLTLPRQGWPWYFLLWFFCPIHLVVDWNECQLPSESQLLICPIKWLILKRLSNEYFTRKPFLCGQVTQEKIDAVNAARAELETACNPLKLKKPKKARAEWNL